MKADHLSYRRATSVALLGLGLQLLLGTALLIYGAIAKDHASRTASFQILIGGIAWLALAMVFNQHRRAKVEELEAEALSETGRRESSVFEGSDDELRVAAKQLAWMHKVLLPAVSLVMAGALVIVGAIQLSTGDDLLGEGFRPPRDRGFLIAIAVAIGVIGFIFARFVSGMAKQPVWANLRAGAAQAAGAALFGVSLVVGQFVDVVGPDTVARYLQVIFPAAMIVLGAEIVLNFVLGIYRPRRAGEVPRPAFDSRILAFVAAPDRIADSVGEALSYQFGIDVTRSWFYQLLRRFLVGLIGLGALVVWLMTMIGVVRPNEQGLRVRMGSLVGEPMEPGPYLKLPWPFERIERYPTSALRRLDLGTQAPTKEGAILWTKAHIDVDERFFIVQPAAADVRAERTGQSSDGLVRGVSLVAAEVPLYYAVKDLGQFERFAHPRARNELIQAVGRREVMAYLATHSVDDLLSHRRIEASRELAARIESRLEELNAGIEVVFVGLEGVHPPVDTALEFEKVVANERLRDGRIDLGRKDKIETLTNAVGNVELAERIVREIDAIRTMREGGAGEDALIAQTLAIEELLMAAGGNAASTIAGARADRWQRHMEARGRSELHSGQLAMFEANPVVFTANTYFTMLTDLLRENRIMIVPPGVEVWLDNKEADEAGNVFQKVREGEESRQ